MRRRFSSQPQSVDSRQRNTRRQRVRKLTFDSLEDRRLLAGLNVFVYDDVNHSGGWESPSENPIAEQVVYVDQNDDGRLGGQEPYAITDADGKALIENLASGIAILRLLGATTPGTPVVISNSNATTLVNLAGEVASGNSVPRLGNIPNQSVDEDSSLSLSRSVFEDASADADDDPLWFFIVGKPSNGTLVWSVETGGVYLPNDNYYGNDTMIVRAFDGKSWSSETTVDLAVNSVDDLPTAIEFAGGTIPENQLGFVIGPITIVDIDGGPNSIQLTPEDRFEIQDGQLRLIGGTSLNFEESPSSELTIRVIVGDEENSVAVLSSTATLAVENRNDAPSALEFVGQRMVEEFVEGFEFGSFNVIDEDNGDRYDFHVSDNRFDVIDGKLALKAGVSLVFSDTPFVSISVTAVSQTSSDTLSETLQIEVVRAAPPWQNKHWALDVNDDGELSPVDVLIVINALNRMGVSPLDRLPPSGSSTFVDVNGDRVLTPLDALILINALNLRSQGAGGGSSGGSGNGSGGQSGSSGGVGEGEEQGPAPTAPLQVAGDFQRTDRMAGSVGNIGQATPLDDDGQSPFNTRKTARRVR